MAWLVLIWLRLAVDWMVATREEGICLPGLMRCTPKTLAICYSRPGPSIPHPSIYRPPKGSTVQTVVSRITPDSSAWKLQTTRTVWVSKAVASYLTSTHGQLSYLYPRPPILPLPTTSYPTCTCDQLSYLYLQPAIVPLPVWCLEVYKILFVLLSTLKVFSCVETIEGWIMLCEEP